MGLTAEQLKMRSGPDGFVGGSEIARVAGISHWGRPIDVWLEKTGRAEAEPENPRADIGLRAEAVMIQWYCEDTGTLFSHCVRGESVRHPTKPYMGCTPDFLIHGKGWELVRLAQMKCVGARMALGWSDTGVPVDVECQVQHEMEVTSAPAVDVVAWLGGTDFRVVTIERDLEFGEMLANCAEQFWECVKNDEPPPIDGSETWRRYLSRRFPVVEKLELAPANDDVDRWAQESLRQRERIAQALQDQEAADNHLRMLIGDGRGFIGSDYRVTWDADKNGKRTLRVKRRKQAND